MYATFDLPALGDWLTRKEFSGPDAAMLANADAGFRDRDGFHFVGPNAPYLRIETGEFGFHALRFGRVMSSGHQYRLKAGHEDWLVIAWPESGVLCATSEQGMVSAHRGQCLVVPPGTRTITALPEDDFFRSTRLLISTSALQTALARIQVPPDAKINCVSAPLESMFGSILYATTVELMRGMAGKSPKGIRKRQHQSAEQGIVAFATSFLLEVDAVSAESQLSDNALELVRSAETVLRQSVADEFSIGQLARHLGIGERRLQLVFESVRGYSPRAYQQAIRLEKARQHLISASADNAVTDAALTAGFSHLGRFSEFYRRRYGETPSSSLRRARNPKG